MLGGDAILDIGCGPGADLPDMAVAVGPAGRVIGLKVSPITSVSRDVRAADKVLGLQRVTERAVSAGYFSRAQASLWLDNLAEGPFFASMTLFVVAAAN